MSNDPDVRSTSLSTASSKRATRSDSVEYFLDHPNILRRPANKTTSNHDPVLATFDADNAIIWANGTFLTIAQRNERSRRALGDEDVETLTHEFVRALHYREIFQDHYLHEDRVRELRKLRTRIIMRSTPESYANRILAEERRAEETAQRVRMEILSSFDREQNGNGISMLDIENQAEENAAGLFRVVRDEYRSSAKREFARIHGAGGDKSRAFGGNGFAAQSAGSTVILLRDLRWLFPLDKSATLADLVDELIGFRMSIVVPTDSA